jgi:hypothetical protein
MVLQGEMASHSPEGRGESSGFRFRSEDFMKVLLIVVVFNFDTGSELETRMDFTDEATCHAAALERFRELDAEAEIREMDIPEGQEMLEGTMIAYGVGGAEIGMYACNELRRSRTKG